MRPLIAQPAHVSLRLQVGALGTVRAEATVTRKAKLVHDAMQSPSPTALQAAQMEANQCRSALPSSCPHLPSPPPAVGSQ